MEEKTIEKTRQEEAYEFIAQTFLKLLGDDEKISYEHKRSVIVFWQDLFAHEGVRNNMLQAFSNFLDEIDGKMDSARKAGMQHVRELIEQTADVNGTEEIYVNDVLALIDEALKVENTPEEAPIDAKDLENMDLSEVGGGDEDDTSPL